MSRSAIDSYTAAVDRALPGPRRARHELVAELRDGLCDAADAYREAGLSTVEAERRAVDECGSVREIADEFRTEIAATQGHRGALLIACTMLASTFAWEVVWQFVSYRPVRPVVMRLSDVVDWAAWFASGSALLAIGLLVFAARAGLRVRPVLGGLVVVSALAMVVIVAGSITMNVDGSERAWEVLRTSPAVVGVTAFSAGALVVQVCALWRIVSAVFGVRELARLSRRSAYERSRA